MRQAEVSILERPSDGLRVLRYYDWRTGEDDVALWSLVKLRKHTTCVVSGRELHPGDMAFRPTGNKSYRMMRIAPETLP